MEAAMHTTKPNGRVTVFGYGPTGEATVKRLRARGQTVRVVQRRRPANLPSDIEFQTCDALNPGDVLNAMTGAEQAVITIGFEYTGKVWRTAWPKAMANFIAAAEATGARIVHIDNLYMTRFGLKPAARAEATRMWMKASEEKRILWAALRAPDFYGPGVGRSHIGDVGFGMIARAKPSTLIVQPDMPHAFAYVPDIARAVLSLLDAEDDAFGQAWHVPCAPTLTPREVLKLGADALGQKLRIVSIPGGMLPIMGLVSPSLRELSEMRFTWDRPYHVDTRKFASRFWSDPTPFETGARATALAFAEAEAAKAGAHGELAAA
jgi:nucleoside-diphosphate-sugar epimerase